MIENRRIKFLLGSEVAKDHGFRNSGSLGDFFSGGAHETSVRKEAHRHTQYLMFPVLGGHPGTIGAGACQAFRKRYLLAQIGLFPLRLT